MLNLTATVNDPNLRGTPSSSYSTSNSSSEEDGSFRTARDISASPHDRMTIYEHRETAIPASLSLSASTSSANTITPNTHKPSPGFSFAPTGALPFSPTGATFSPTSPYFSPTTAPFSPTSSSTFSFSPASSPSSFVPGYGHSGSGYPGFGYSVDAAKVSPSPGTGQGQLQLQTPETVIYTPSRAPSSAASSIFTSRLSDSGSQEESHDDEDGNNRGLGRKTTVADYDGYDSPPPVNELIAEARNERRYRLLLVHDFHPSCKLTISLLGCSTNSNFYSDTSIVDTHPRRVRCNWVPLKT